MGNLWIGEEHLAYELLSMRPNITKDYCPQCTEVYRKQWKEIKREYQLMRN